MGLRSKSIKNKVYKFVHNNDEFIRTTIIGKTYSSANKFIELKQDGTLLINGAHCNGYAWDGCTPKWEFLDFTLGTPDGRFDYLTEKPITYYASMIHDAIYQHKKEIPISRKSADQIFYQILKESGFMWARLYYIFVRVAGGIFGKWKSDDKVKNLQITESSWLNEAHQNTAN